MIRSLLASFCFASVASAQAPPTTFQVTFHFDRPVAGVPVPHYTIELHGDGTGLYHADVPIPQTTETQKIDRPLVFTPDAVLSVVAAVGIYRAAGIACASKAKNIADTGTKTLTFHTIEGDGTCTFNYSESKAVIQLTTLFEGVETTLEEGRTLDFKHRFDRLGLDAEMATLATSVEEGRALELANIAPTLRSIAADTELIQRVRLKAAKLLERASGS